MRTPEQCIQQEILRLQLVIACGRYDYVNLILAGKPKAERALLADDIEYNLFMLRCLQLGDYKNLPYNIKMLYDK